MSEIKSEIKPDTVVEIVTTLVPPVAIPAPFDRLTTTQFEVAVELALGAKNTEIAKRRGISTKTVDTHRGKILRTLELRSNVQLARAALRAGLVKLDQTEDL